MMTSSGSSGGASQGRGSASMTSFPSSDCSFIGEVQEESAVAKIPAATSLTRFLFLSHMRSE